jgi:hypothetical protein
MLSIVLPSKRLAALPEEAIGEASVTVFSQMANPEKRHPAKNATPVRSMFSILRSCRCGYNDRFWAP